MWGISTSSTSENVVRALAKGRESGMRTLALTGAGGGDLAAHADILIAVPTADTARIQEAHICPYHYICEHVEKRLAG